MLQSKYVLSLGYGFYLNWTFFCTADPLLYSDLHHAHVHWRPSENFTSKSSHQDSQKPRPGLMFLALYISIYILKAWPVIFLRLHSWMGPPTEETNMLSRSETYSRAKS